MTPTLILISFNIMYMTNVFHLLLRIQSLYAVQCKGYFEHMYWTYHDPYVHPHYLQQHGTMTDIFHLLLCNPDSAAANGHCVWLVMTHTHHHCLLCLFTIITMTNNSHLPLLHTLTVLVCRARVVEVSIRIWQCPV